MRAIAKFCEHEQASTRLNFASKSSKGKILRAVEKLYDHSIPLHITKRSSTKFIKEALKYSNLVMLSVNIDGDFNKSVS